METNIFQSLLCHYAGEGNQYVAPEHLSRRLSNAECQDCARLAREIGQRSVALFERCQTGDFMADLGNHTAEVGLVKVVAQLGWRSESELTASLFATQPNAIHPTRNVPGVSFDISDVELNHESAAEGSTLGDLATLRLVHDALSNAVQFPAEATVA